MRRLATFSLQERTVAPSSYHHVIEYGDPEHAARVDELAGHRAVFRGRRRVAGRVIVHENQRRRPLPPPRV